MELTYVARYDLRRNVCRLALLNGLNNVDQAVRNSSSV
jgi:hypothetical protein